MQQDTTRNYNELWNQVMSKTPTCITQTISRRVGNRHDAEELTQETLLRLWNGGLDRYTNSPENLDAWLRRVAFNIASNYMRTKKSRRTFTNSSRLHENDECIGEDNSATQNPSAKFEQQEQSHALRNAIACLPLHYRGTLTLRYFSSLTYEEIASMQSIPVNTARVRVQNGKKLLREALKDYESTTTRNSYC